MLSEPILDGVALAFLLITGFAWAKVLRSCVRIPDNWIGPQAEFDQRLRRERRWSVIGWFSLIAAMTVIDFFVN